MERYIGDISIREDRGRSMITARNSILGISMRREFSEIRDILYPPFVWTQSLFPLSFVITFARPWSGEDVVNGLNFLSESCLKGARRIELCGGESSMLFIPADKPAAPWAVICPGGSYAMTVPLVEGYPVAERLNAAGYAVFVLNYRVGRHALYPRPVDDLSAAVDYAISHADELGLSRSYCVFGFSAGGHLAALFGTRELGARAHALPSPFALVLGYPVVSMEDTAHRVSRKNLLGRDAADESTQRRFSVELNVDGDYPPSYIWRFDEDPSVDPDNSLMLARSLEMAGREHVLRGFPGAVHGCGLGTGTPAEVWIDEALAFLEKMI